MIIEYFPLLWQGVPSSKIEDEVEQTLKEVYLHEKKDTKTADLSGKFVPSLSYWSFLCIIYWCKFII